MTCREALGSHHFRPIPERSPVAIASSIFTTAVRKRERRALLTIVRRAIWRAALRAELVLAIGELCVRLSLYNDSKRRAKARR